MASAANNEENVMSKTPSPRTSAADDPAAGNPRVDAYAGDVWRGYRQLYGDEGFSYKGYFNGINLTVALQVMPDEIAWLTSVPRTPEPHDTVLYLGCNAMRTPHLVLAAIDVLKAMGEDLVTIGGPANCCGIVHNLHRDFEVADKVSKTSTDKILRFQPKNVLTICPNCNYTYEHVTAKTQEVPFEMVHFYEYVHANLDKLSFAKPYPKRIGLHRHLGDSHHQDRHGRMCADILAAIAGVTVVDLPTFEELGALCTLRSSTSITEERYEDIMAGLFGAAAAAGCDTMGVVYHSCQRELAAQAHRAPVAVKSVYEIVAEALGCPHEDKLARFRAIGDVDAVLAEVAPNIAAYRIDPAAARRLIASIVG